MLDRARVLILEDDLLWIETLSDILQPTDIVQPKVQYLQAATNLSNAFELLHRDYFNLAIVDISLVPGNDADSQGMRFLAYLQETGLDEAVSTIMLSAYGNIASVSSSFRDFQVSDFLVKGEFSRTVLIEAIQRALTKSKRDTAPQIEISRRRQIPDLWQRFNWPTREDEAQLTAELQDLLTRLFPGAQHLFLDDMPTGQSGAGVLRVTPTYEAAVGTPVVVKFGKRDKIQIERENYLKHIERFAGNHSSTQLTAAGGRAMAAITYSFIGTELENVKSFAEFYHANDVAAIERAIDNLFRKTCSRWYDGHERLRQIRNLVYLYESGLNIDWAEVWENAAFTVQDIAQPRLAFPGIAGDFENPRLWLEAQANEINMQVWRCVTHGDLNQNNVLVTDDGRCWLIDFYRTGEGHILRDVVELETAIKFGICSFQSPADYMELEQLLLKQSAMDKPILVESTHSLHKPLAVIAYLRKMADLFTGADKTLREYEVGLLLTTLNLLTIKFYQKQRHQIMLSAAMLCEKLAHNNY